MKIRLITSDIDGTLLPHGARQFSLATLDIARACREKGVHFTVATGRLVPHALAAARELGITTPVITSNGGIIASPGGEIIKEFPIGIDSARKVASLLLGMGLKCSCYCAHGHFKMDPKEPASFVDASVPGLQFSVVTNDIFAFENEGLPNACKMETYSDDAKKLACAMGALAEMGFSVSQSFPTNIEIMPAGLGKGAALRYLADYLGVSQDETMAMGDNTNDGDMLLASAFPVAVGNAVPALKAVAKYVAEPSADDGASKAVRRFALEEPC